MKFDKRCPILVKAENKPVYQRFTAKEAGWEYLNFLARKMKRGETWSENTGGYEYCIVLMGGNFSVKSNRGEWETVNGRKDVFSGLPHALYLPADTQFTLTADSDTLDIAVSWVKTDRSYEPIFVTPQISQDLGIELRGGDNASRQINRMLPPGSACHRLVCVEVYTPAGNWSSFPAHKHDERKVDADGKLKEACLEEIYFYKIDKPQGFAFQHVYTEDRQLDEIAEAHDGDVVLVPRGHHPVVAGPGYNVYYLNFLAGSDQSLAASDDPDHQWLYGQWKTMDSRLPLVTLEMNKITN
ncbi:MAG: 5-deoxy-glucuronate isomerase [Tannerella sp.]|jgi:5-deoxy-glucuronate isomerase|nr:5-deoxy-glucuronate isomerase [Tannerella sp.]